MMIFKTAIPRRAFLRGAGATLALPLLDGMVPAFAATGDAAAKPAVRKVLREAAPNGYRWSSVILSIVKSTPFQMRRSRES